MGRWCSIVAGVLVVVAFGGAVAEPDPTRGARLYLQLPASRSSCVDCHGAEAAGNRNNLLLAADRPLVLTRALGGVAAMGFLRASVGPAEVEDLAAYLSVVRSGLSAPVLAWPGALDFGTLQVGAAVAEHRLWLQQIGSAPLELGPPELIGQALPGDFELRHDCPSTLLPGRGCTLWLRASRHDAGDASATLRWLAAGQVGLVPIAARWVSEPTGVLSSQPAGGDLGLVASADGQPVATALDLLNTGDAPLTLLATSLSGPDAGAFTLDAGCSAGTLLLPGERCTIRVSALPAPVGGLRAALHWRSTGRSLPPFALVAASPASGPASAPAALGPLYTGGGAGLSTALFVLLAFATACLVVHRPSTRVTGPSSSGHADVIRRS